MGEKGVNFVVVSSDSSTNNLYEKVCRELRVEDIRIPVLKAESLREAALLARENDRSVLIADTREIKSLRELSENYNKPEFLRGMDSPLAEIYSCSLPRKGDSAEEVKFIWAYVRTHIADDLNLSNLSSLIGVSPNYLCTLFHKQTGVSLGKFIRNNRLRYAAYLLETEWTQIDEIAVKVGFTSASYFCKLFKEAYGMTPKRYRMTHSKIMGR